MERPVQVRTGATGTKTGTRSGVSLRSLPAGTFTTIEKLDRDGSLQARKLTGETAQFYWRDSHEGRATQSATRSTAFSSSASGLA